MERPPKFATETMPVIGWASPGSSAGVVRLLRLAFVHWGATDQHRYDTPFSF